MAVHQPHPEVAYFESQAFREIEALEEKKYIRAPANTSLRIWGWCVCIYKMRVTNIKKFLKTLFLCSTIIYLFIYLFIIVNVYYFEAFLIVII